MTDVLGGTYCFIFCDEAAALLLVGTYRFCQLPLFCLFEEGILALATEVESVLAAKLFRPELNKREIYNFYYFYISPVPNCIYREVQKLPAANRLIVEGAQASANYYWTPHFEERNKKTLPTQGNKFKRLPREPVRRFVERGQNRAGFLSGGLDSSTVTSMLAELCDHAVDAYTISINVDGYGEISYAETKAQYFSIRLQEYCVIPDDVVLALASIDASYPRQFEYSSAQPAWCCALFAAEDGIRCMFAGDGGDKPFAGIERYVNEFLLKNDRSTPSCLRKYFIEPSVKVLPTHLSLVKKARSVVKQAKMPLPERPQTYNSVHAHTPVGEIRDELLDDIMEYEPIELERAIYHTPAGAPPPNKMSILDWHHAQEDNYLRKMSKMCEKAWIEFFYPMMDDNLARSTATLPRDLDNKGRNLRHLYKQVLRNWLPEGILAEKKHGFGLPFGNRMRGHTQRQQLVYDNLLCLKEHSCFRPDFSDKVIELYRKCHARYCGELVWILMSLNLWQARQLG